MEFIEAIHPRRLRGQLTAAEWMDLVAHLICAVLSSCSQASSKLYNALAEQIFPDADASDCRNRVITFNYDTLLDRSILEYYPAHEVCFDDIRLSRSGRKAGRFDAPLMLKLHGSANWRCTASDLERIVRGLAAADDEVYVVPTVWLGGRELPVPGSDVSPLIIPPLPAKPIAEIKLFRYLWTRAFEYLHEAREIVVIGYSLPPADTMAAAMFGSFTSSKLNHVSIVDPSPNVMLRWRRLFRRSQVPHAHWSYFEGLDEFLASADA